MADSQSKEIQDENRRVVRVNAQVTAMISISEIVGFIIISIISVTANSTTIADMLFPMLENIILPYAFLMNTRENKYRIVEQGWKNVLWNALNVNYLCTLCSNSDRVEVFDNTQNKDEEEVYVVSKNVLEMSRIVASPKHKKTISVDIDKNVSECDKPCSSRNQIKKDDNDKNARKIVRTSSSSSEESQNTLSVTQARMLHEGTQIILSCRKELLNVLLLNVDEEAVYLSALTRLITLESDHSLEEGDLDEICNVDKDMIIDKVSLLLTKGNAQHRIKRRKNLIKTLQTFQNTEDKYQEIFNIFLNMEEQFLEDREFLENLEDLCLF